MDFRPPPPLPHENGCQCHRADLSMSPKSYKWHVDSFENTPLFAHLVYLRRYHIDLDKPENAIHSVKYKCHC